MAKKSSKKRVVPRWLVVLGIIGFVGLSGYLTWRVINPIQVAQSGDADAAADVAEGGASGPFAFLQRGSEDAVIETGAVVSIDAIQSVEASGGLEALQNDNVFWETSGRVGEVLINVGDEVVKGDVMMTIETASVSEQIINTQAELLAAQTALNDLLNPTQLQIAQAWDAIVVARETLDDAKDTVRDLTYVDHEYYQDEIEKMEDAVDQAQRQLETAERGVIAADRQAVAAQQTAETLAFEAQKTERTINNAVLTTEQQGALVELGPLVDAVKAAQSELQYNQEQFGNAQVAHNDNCKTRAEDEDLPECRTTDAIHYNQSLDQWTQNVLDAERKLEKAQLDLDVARQNNAKVEEDALFQAQETALSLEQQSTNNQNAMADAQQAKDDAFRDISDANEAIADAQEDLAEAIEDYEIAQGEPGTFEVADAQSKLQLAEADLADKEKTYDELVNGADPIDIAAAEARILAAEITLSKLNLLAPFDSTVLETNYMPGDTVQNSQYAVQLADLTQLHIILSIDETDVPQIQVGQEATLTFDSIPNEEFSGVVTDIAAFGEETQGIVRYDVQIDLTDKDDRLKLGMTANVEIVTDILEGALAVPLDTIQLDDEGEYVMLLEPDGVTQTRVPVVTGLLQDDLVLVEGELSEGQELVLFDPRATDAGGPFGGGE